MDHHRVLVIFIWIWIITRHHHRCYLLILLVTGSSIEPALFHVGFRPSLQVGLHLLQHLYLTKSKRLAQHLHLTMVGNSSQTMPKGLALISDHDRKLITHHVRKSLHLYLIMWNEHIPQSHLNGSQSQTEISSNWPGASILPENGLLALKLSFSPRLKFLVTN